MNTNDILKHMIANSPWVNPETTVDKIKSGDGNKTIKKVAVCWYPSIKTIQSAIDAKCDLLVTHEPTWWDHFDEPGGWRQKSPGLKKTQMLEESGLVIARLHDTWDNWPKIGIRDSFAKGLGLDKFIAEDKTRWLGMNLSRTNVVLVCKAGCRKSFSVGARCCSGNRRSGYDC